MLKRNQTTWKMFPGCQTFNVKLQTILSPLSYCHMFYVFSIKSIKELQLLFRSSTNKSNKKGQINEPWNSDDTDR